MPRTCTICTHPQRQAIDQALIAGEPLRTIADRWSVSKTAVLRHKESHLPSTLLKAQSVSEVTRADGLVHQVSQVRDKALSLLAQAETERDWRCCAVLLREIRASLELLTRVKIQAGEMLSLEEVRAMITTAAESLKGAVEKHVMDRDERHSVLRDVSNEMERMAERERAK